MDTTNKSFTILAVIFAIGSMLYLTLGQGYAVNWLGAGIAGWLLWQNIWVGLIAALAYGVIFIVPPIMEPIKEARQRNIIQNIEMQSDPINLKGKRVLFLAGDDVGCVGICENIMQQGLVEKVYFHRLTQEDPNSALLNGATIDLSQISPWEAVKSYQSIIVQDAPPNALQDGIDYVILFALNDRAEDQALFDHVNGTTNVSHFTNNSRYMEAQYYIRVYEHDGTSQFQLHDDKLIFSLINTQRIIAKFPYNPFNRVDGATWDTFAFPGYVTDMGLRTVQVLCGAPHHTNYETCVTYNLGYDAFEKQFGVTF